MTNNIEKNVGPLKDIIVADFSQLAQGPWATQMLGDMGADIIKIEPETDEWLEILIKENIWRSQVNTFEEMVKDLQIKHNEMIIEIDHPVIGKVKTTGFPVWFSETPQKIYNPAPILNGNAKEILKEICSYGDGIINTFIKEDNQK